MAKGDFRKAKGVIPWKEGDELSEHIICRLRDGGKDAKPYYYRKWVNEKVKAASQLKLLRRLNDPRYLKKCPFCFGGPVEGWGTFCHIADCELAKELSDDK